ncbi:MAG: HesA/MoeB/ThiF family protein [Lachnospiraceae bacterium]|nr:HesA/MoeB/ThiF family protein [Lachnospiraceae bacterium]
MKARYIRNFEALSEAESDLLKTQKICIVGCGGLGGYILEQFLRLGVESITVIDGDCFEESNLNRQLLSTENVIGNFKALTAKERAQEVNSQIKVHAVNVFLTEENARELLKGHDIVMDAVDNIAARRIMGKTCEELGIPLMYGAIQGWYAQISLILPGSSLLDILYQKEMKLTSKSSLSFTPAVCASFQVAEAVKYLCGRECPLKERVLYVDMLSMEAVMVKF